MRRDRLDRSLILATAVDVVFHTALVFSAFLLFRGHNAPGGGFVGGLVAGAAFVIRYVDGGVASLRTRAFLRPATLLGGGLALALATGMLGWSGGGAFLDQRLWSVDLPVLGSVKAGTALPFDVGVYLVVVGLVLALLRTLGAEEDAP